MHAGGCWTWERSMIVAPGDMRVRLSNFPSASITRRTHVDHKPILLSHWYYLIKFTFSHWKLADVYCISMASLRPQYVSWSPFLESPETFRTHFEWHNSLCIFKTKASRGTKLCDYLNFYSLYNIWKYQLLRISESECCEWIFGSEKFSGLSRNGPQRIMEQADDVGKFLGWNCVTVGYVVINKFLMIINDMFFFFLLSCSTLSDELSRLWRLAVLNPCISGKQRQAVVDQLMALNEAGTHPLMSCSLHASSFYVYHAVTNPP